LIVDSKTKLVTQTAPTIATKSKLEGTSFAVVMIDLDIPTAPPHTLLHWLQTGLTQSSSAIALNTTMGSTNAFVLSVPGDEAAFAPYIGPAPPARNPLSHRYTQILVDTSAASEQELAALKQAAGTRMGFIAQDVLTSAGLADKIVAGNFFNVTNPGPISGATTSNSTTGGGNGTNSGSSSPTPSPVPGAAISQRSSASFAAIVMVGVVFFAL
jgi:phosphatidylethanolamine-binding protein (PEBP) family uncharacterized protein